MANLRDVAKMAQVGVGTVSRAMNGTGYVSEETRKKIEAAVRELNYTPNELARNLFRKRTGIIGVVLPDVENPFFAKFLKYTEIELYKRGYKTMACNTIDISDREKDYIDMLERNMVDGIITGAHSLHDDDYLKINGPIVSLDRDFGPGIPLIHSDHIKGGRMAAQRLILAGCRNVVQFGGAFHVNTPSNQRHTEFERVMKKNGVRVTTVEMAWNMLNYEYYQSAMEQYMDFYEEADGIFAADIGAVCCLNLALKRGIQVPEKIKIIGYDAMDLTRIINPCLTAVRQNVQLLAEQCVATILALIENSPGIDYHQVVDVCMQEGGTV